MKRMLIVLVVLVTVFSVACSAKLIEKRALTVDRVFWHEGTRYSVMVSDPSPSSHEIRTVTFNMWDGEQLHIYRDVPEGNSPWVYYEVTRQAGDEHYSRLDIHVSSAAQIDGASWNHGKFGSGQTAVIQ